MYQIVFDPKIYLMLVVYCLIWFMVNDKHFDIDRKVPNKMGKIMWAIERCGLASYLGKHQGQSLSQGSTRQSLTKLGVWLWPYGLGFSSSLERDW